MLAALQNKLLKKKVRKIQEALYFVFQAKKIIHLCQ
jgi:hypothetical protein